MDDFFFWYFNIYFLDIFFNFCCILCKDIWAIILLNFSPKDLVLKTPFPGNFKDLFQSFPCKTRQGSEAGYRNRDSGSWQTFKHANLQTNKQAHTHRGRGTHTQKHTHTHPDKSHTLNLIWRSSLIKHKRTNALRTLKTYN